MRAHRLLAVQRALRPPDPPGAAARQLPRAVEPQRLPVPRGFRLRHHAVQLHGDRRQPPDRAGAHGQHRRVEAVALTAACGPADDGAPRGGGDAAGRHQPRRGSRSRGVGGGPGSPGVRRPALHRLDGGLPGAVARDRAEPHDLPALPADRRRDRWQGLHPRAPECGPRRAAHRDDPGRLRVPGAEVLRGLPGLRAAVGVAADQGRPAPSSPTACPWETSPTCRTSWAR